MQGGFSYQIASVYDREELIAELLYDDEQWGEISKENGHVVLELYGREDGQPWRFPPKEVESLIYRARRDLVEGKPPKTRKHPSTSR